jgi:hypothetical protein
MFDQVLADPAPALAAERAAYLDYAASFVE